MGKIEFTVTRKECKFLDPRNNWDCVVVPIEIRRDPLTGRTARICHFRVGKWKSPDFSAVISGTEVWCPFCPDKVLEKTPRFPEEILPEGRLIRQDSVLFPNLAPYDGISAVVSIGPEHFLPMTGFSVERLVNAFGLCFSFFERLRERKHPEAVHPLIMWNYMPASGSSVIHPHLQILSSSSSPNLLRERDGAALNYYRKTGRNFWDDFIEEERGGERYIARTGRIHWISAFAPSGVAGDVLAIVKEAHTFFDLPEEDLTALCEGFTRVMAAYEDFGMASFNLALYQGSLENDHSCLHAVFSPRTYFYQKLGTPDTGAIRHLFDEPIVMSYPEEIALHIRSFFERA